jgi:hypothetical protein
MQIAAYLYPWDIVDDPAAPELIAGLGLGHVLLAAACHATRAVTPRHPAHRLVTAPYSAAYYTVDPNRWAGRQLQPAMAAWTGVPDAFERAATALDRAGVAVHAWAVLNHVDLTEAVEPTVVNAFGDHYPWALCPAQDAVLEYGVGLAADLAALSDIGGVELEACGWYGVDHTGAHDKAGTALLSFADRYLLSLCFCAACTRAYIDAGVSPGLLRRTVRASLEPAFAGRTRPGSSSDVGELAEIDALLGVELSAAVGQVRRDIAERYRAAVVAEIRRCRADLPILLHANPRAHRSAAFTGIDPAGAAFVDGLVVNCWSDLDNLSSTVGARVPVYASLMAVSGLGGAPATLPAQVASAGARGAAGVRFYHAGLATNTDLEAIRAVREQPIEDRSAS